MAPIDAFQRLAKEDHDMQSAEIERLRTALKGYEIMLVHFEGAFLEAKAKLTRAHDMEVPSDAELVSMQRRGKLPSDAELASQTTMLPREKALWDLLEEVQAQVDLPAALDDRVTVLLWAERDRSDD